MNGGDDEHAGSNPVPLTGDRCGDSTKECAMNVKLLAIGVVAAVMAVVAVVPGVLPLTGGPEAAVASIGDGTSTPGGLADVAGHTAGDAAELVAASVPAPVSRMDISVASAGGADDGTRISAHRRGSGEHRGALGIRELTAEALGMTVEELSEARTEGTSLLDLAVAQGLDADQFTSDLADSIRAAIESAVEAGDIETELAERLLENLDERVEQKVSRDGVGCGKHRHGSGGGTEDAASRA
jgi:hypothetical protein